MAVFLHTMRQGNACTLYAFGEADAKDVVKIPPLGDFLGGLNAEDQAKMASFIDRVAMHGPPVNREKCKLVAGDIHEFKSHQVRILWFWEKNRVIICTHGFIKKRDDIPRSEISRAHRYLELYQEAKQQNKIQVI